MTTTPLKRMIAQAIDIVVHIRRTREGRRIEAILDVDGPGPLPPD